MASSRRLSEPEVVLVTTVAELHLALQGSADIIRIAAGTYEISSTLQVSRSVTLVADVYGSVVFDGLDQGPRGDPRGSVSMMDECFTGYQIMTIDYGTVEIIGIHFAYGCSGMNSNLANGALVGIGMHSAGHNTFVTFTRCIFSYGTSKYFAGYVSLGLEHKPRAQALSPSPER
jgi:hypothetical protein